MTEPTQPGFEIRDPRFHDIIAPEAKLERLATGFVFTEGPIWHEREGYALFSDIAASVQYRWSEVDGVSVFRRPSNQANGNCFDRQGRVITCEHAASQVIRHDHEGKLIAPIATHFDGRELNSPNDVICDSKGRIWFTDPSFGRQRPELGIVREEEQACRGVYRLDPDGALHLVTDDFEQPNGLCLSNDETTLFINDSARPCIRSFAVNEDGTLTGDEVWADVTGGIVLGGTRKWVPDGMKVDIDGNLFCNGPGGVHIFTADADCLGVILMPEKSTNFCFSGKALDALIITASTGLYRIRTKTRAKQVM
ncbi:SMP-30/gluconolactonase/LRE family protein [Ahrensia sp. R2A130]|uniref:SMP-30/gluconolactonase/LRE family protein n=1 Tax=Ahrensia sp. R2A130 TaxID=744979 RepID=UPI0001E0D88A|nr:SMP-30/gluconolactonase/LRE family protein [Ahrensia sp. R2A130]EFL87927.1 gluconolactonase [Ahrensia sp. R2A130]